jgi:hypothetical protein
MHMRYRLDRHRGATALMSDCASGNTGAYGYLFTLYSLLLAVSMRHSQTPARLRLVSAAATVLIPGVILSGQE